ncbi:protein transport protein SEC61 alpha subunit [Perkinsela sp. CCAP 1560/4]|nr:protein transport protein SEC61 alpha subunit [Perkinsela sp. CCAP 1560/4]|eukprot:KNH04067.1 protein transport protein SEC61 alpha subunit [Perkinsela sp. CCAP 1560/4]
MISTPKGFVGKSINSSQSTFPPFPHIFRMGQRLLDYVKPFVGFFPTVQKPERKVHIRDKLVYTMLSLFIFLVSSQIPVYGIKTSKSADPFYWMRIILATNKGTIMELGISPMITASMIMELLSGAKLVNLTSKDDRTLYSTCQKLLAVVMTIVQAFGCVMSGIYGDYRALSFLQIFLIMSQLLLASLLCVLLDDLLSKGWGISSGTSLFIACNICDTIVWKCLSPTTLSTGRGTEFEGALIALFHMLTTRSDKLRAIKEALHRPHLPNITNLLSTGLILFVVIFLQGFRVDLPLVSTKYRGATATHPIKLFYTSNMPIILQAAFVSNIYFFSQLLYKRFSSNFLIGLLGRWEEMEYNGQSVPVGGLAYYISAPRSFTEVFADPFHAAFYVAFVLVTCAGFSTAWIAVSGTSARDVARQIRGAEMTIKGFRNNEDEMAQHLDRYIPTAAAFGGMCIGILTILADFLGAIGSGTGILLAVSILQQYYETFAKEGEDLGITAGM